MARLTLLLGVLGLAVFALGVLPRAGPVAAGQLLENAGFEGWAGTTPTSWSINGMSAAQSSTAVSGSSAALTLSGGSGWLRQPAAAIAGAAYNASIFVSAPAGVSVTLSVRFFDSLQYELASLNASQSMTGAFVPITAFGTAPSGTESATFHVEFSSLAAPVQVFVDSASLNESIPPPTATPTPEPTATQAPPTATIAGENTATPAPTGAPAAPTAADGTATKTPAATRTPTSTRTPTPPKQATATRTPTAPRPPTSTRAATATGTAAATATPTPRSAAVEAFGGLLVNGNFEDVHDDHPVGWSKFGGSMGISPDAFRGESAATLDSSTSSTKWLYQVVGVEPGAWYTASAQARLEGTGVAFVRLSWYSADDGGGTALSQDDSNETHSDDWTLISTGSIHAPADAHSVRFRLTLRPAGTATAFFDDALLVESSAPVPDPITLDDPPSAPLDTGPASAPDPPAASQLAPSPSQPPAAALTSGDTAGSTAGRGLRLSEFLSDPEQAGRDSAFEWVEILNTSPEPVALGGWSIGDGRETDVLPAALIPPNAYLVLAAKSVQLPAGIAVVRLTDGEIGAGLNNTSDTIRLIAPGGDEVDALSFGDDDSVFDPPPPPPPAGKSLGNRSPASDPDAANWAITLRPTPGEANEFPPAPTPPAKAGAASAAVIPAAAGSLPVAVNRGEGGSSILWIAGAALAAAAILGAAPAWRRYRKKFDLGS